MPVVEKKEEKKDRTVLLLMLCWTLVLVWRMYVLIRYAYRYVDDDQAILWYGTVHFAHGHFPEPCFFGQGYNSMLESLLSVPLYLLGWPLNYALPTVTTILCILPYAFCSVLAWKRGKRVIAFATVIFLALGGWQWDVLTSIPRSFIPGLPWAAIGAMIMNDPEGGRKKAFLGGLLAMLGVSITLSAAAILGVALFALLLEGKKSIRKWPVVILGMLPGFAFLAYQKYFYSVHSADIITVHGFDWFDFDAFGQSMKNIFTLFSQNITGGALLIPLLIISAVVYCFIRKNRKMLLLILVSLAGCVAVMTLGWMSVCGEDSLLFGRIRMVLFWGPLCLFLLSCRIWSKEETQGKLNVPKFMPILAPAFILACLTVKFFMFDSECKDENSPLYNDSWVCIMSVDGLKRQAGQLEEIAKETESDVLVCLNYASVMTYGASAIYYDEGPVFFVPDRDRRIWTYNSLLKEKNQRLMLYSLPVGADMQLAIEDMNDKSIPEYMKERFGIDRSGEMIWGIRGAVE